MGQALSSLGLKVAGNMPGDKQCTNTVRKEAIRTLSGGGGVVLNKKA